MVKLSNNFHKSYQQGQLLVPHLNNWFARGKFPDEIEIIIHPNKEEDDAFHPSSAGLCARVAYAYRHDLMAPRKNTMEANKTFMFGHYAHSLIYFIVQDLGFAVRDDIEKEFDLEMQTEDGNPYRVRGFVDIAKCVIPGQEEPILVDIKTQMARQYAMEPSESLLEKYSSQVKHYLDFTGLSRAIILWAEKDNPHRFKETIVLKDTPFIDESYRKFEYVADCEAYGQVPDCTCGEIDCEASFLEGVEGLDLPQPKV